MKEKIKFKFDQIFDTDTPQEKVFDKVAKDVVESAVEGYNGTIFAYGQTGSGKTYTMTGGGETDDGQGIIPRTLRYIFFLAETKGIDIKVKIRYIQIYNGTGYDLLDPTIDPEVVDKIKTLDDLQRVHAMEGPNGELFLQNVHTHLARNQEDAMGLLLIGDTNRITCKTPKNDESTRSHCIFMINLETTRPGTDVKSVASINLVDLSGS